MAKIEGGCLCGAIRYSSDADPVMSTVCHCSHCQKQTGTSFSTIVGVPREALKVEGTPKVYNDTADSGGKVWRNFCPDCGSPVFSDCERIPSLLFIKAGTLDDRSWFEPGSHIWTGSKQPWVELDESLPSSPDGSRPS